MIQARTGSILIAFLLLLSFVQAQKPAKYMVTAQPGFYVSAYTLAPGNFQIESQIYRVDGENQFGNFSTFTLPSVFLRMGISSNFEVRIKLANQFNKTQIGTFSYEDSGIVPPIIELKARLTPQGTKGPEIAVVLGSQVPFLSSADFEINTLAPLFYVVASQSLSDNNYLNLNLGMAWDGFSPQQPVYNYAISFEQRISGNVFGYLEAFGVYNPKSVFEKITHSYDLGVVIPFSPNSQLDLSAGVQVADQSLAALYALGYSFRFNRAAKKESRN